MKLRRLAQFWYYVGIFIGVMLSLSALEPDWYFITLPISIMLYGIARWGEHYFKEVHQMK
ncbi:hypothetical protein [Leclercia sp.]|uniref:hypothetical protein n=1 Tax=Leclercia sp. TaxID=1898428 RepID=UPI002FDD2A34